MTGGNQFTRNNEMGRKLGRFGSGQLSFAHGSLIAVFLNGKLAP